MKSFPLAHLNPNRENLLHLVFANNDDSMLREIAQADYGLNHEEYFEALLSIRKGQIQVPSCLEAKEVLELIRYSDPEDVSWKPGGSGIRGYWMRLFCCAVLVCAEFECNEYFGPEEHIDFLGCEQTIINFLVSAIVLGPETSQAALEFLCWWVQYSFEEDDYPGQCAIAIALLAVHLNVCDKAILDFLFSEIGTEGKYLRNMIEDGGRKEMLRWVSLIQKIWFESESSPEEIKNIGKILLAGYDSE